MINKIKKAIFFIINLVYYKVPKEYEEKFSTYIYNKSVYILFAIFAINCTLNVISTVSFINYKGIELKSIEEKTFLFYNFLAIFLLIFYSFGFLFLIKFKASSKDKNELIFAGMIFLIFLESVNSAIFLIESHQIFRIIIVFVFLAILPNFGNIKFFIPFFVSNIVFISTALIIKKMGFGEIFLVAGNSAIIYDNDVFIIVLNYSVSIFLIGLIYSKNKFKEFLKTEKFIEAKEELEILNDKLNETNKLLESLSTTDQLTKLNNRRAFDNYLIDIWKKCLKKNFVISAIIFDIDHFKLYNDTFGHQKGDECLFQVASCVKYFFSSTGGILARYGGEEFIAIIPYTSTDIILKTAENIRSAIEKLCIPNPTSPVCEFLTISVGVGICNSVDINGIDELILLADNSLYQVKEQGRNGVIYNSTIKILSKF